MAATEPIRIHFAHKYKRTIANLKPESRPPEDDQADHERLIDLLAYIAEHTGAVLFVAMIIRLGIEAAAQRRALSEVEAAMNDRADVAFESVDQKVKAFEGVSSVDKSVDKVSSSIKSIEGISIGGSLYGQRLKGEAKERIETSVINPVIFRPLYKLCLTLSPAVANDDNCDLVEVKVDTDYSIENLNSFAQPHTIRATLDNVLFRSMTKHMQRDSKFLKCEFGGFIAWKTRCSMPTIRYSTTLSGTAISKILEMRSVSSTPLMKKFLRSPPILSR